MRYVTLSHARHAAAEVVGEFIVISYFDVYIFIHSVYMNILSYTRYVLTLLIIVICIIMLP